MPLSILHVCESTLGGVGRVIADLAIHQLGQGHRVTVAVPAAGPMPARLRAAGATHRAWEVGPRPGPRLPREVRDLARIAREASPDLVHLHSSKAGMAGRLLVRRRRPTVFQPHSWSFFATRGRIRQATLVWERLAVRWADALLCVSEDERRLAESEGVHGAFRVLPNGVDLASFLAASAEERTAARAALGLDPQTPVAVCLGRLHRQKNQGALLDAWPRVRDRVPGARLVLVGDGPDRPALEARQVEGVELVGSVDDPRPWLAAASLVVQPSVWEGMSLSVLEAMARARPVVVTDVPGMREVVVEGTGAVVPLGDPDALAGAVAARLADPALAAAEGGAARRHVEAHHDLATQLDGVDRLYGELLARRGSPTSERLRVLVVQPYGERGGSESWLLRLLDATDALAVHVLLLKDGPLRGELERRGIPVTVRPVGNNPLDLIRPALWLARCLRRSVPDVVLGNVIKAQLVAAPAGLLAGVPTVWAKHDHGYDRWLAAPLGRASTKVVGAVEELAAPAKRDDAVIVPPPRPDEEPADRDAARAHLARLGVPIDERPTMVMAGRLVPFKGVDDAIRALPAVADWRLVVAGEDDHSAPGETERLRALARELGVEARVHFAGHVPAVSHWFAAFDALGVFTRKGGRRDPGMEGFGTSAFEAMLAGIPVVAVEGGAVVRRLEGRAGMGVPASDPAAIAAALGRLSDPAVRSAMGHAAREIVEDHPDAAQCARTLVEVLHDAAHSGPRRP